MRSTILALLTLALTAVFPPAARAENPTRLVELFTSQGCSSCPPADALVGELAGRADVLAISLHVDYWDHLGWRDPFAIPEAVRRQRQYSHSLGLRGLYTPQFVVQGVEDVAGSDRQALERVIDAVAPAVTPTVLHREAADRVTLEMTGAPPEGGADVWLIGFSAQERTVVGRGENGGRELVGVNVVHVLRKIGEWHAENDKIAARFSPEEMRCPERAIILQARSSGLVLAVVRDG